MLAVRLQEMFGAVETPKVAGGRVPVLLQPVVAGIPPHAGDPGPGRFLADHLL